jgi:DnaJ-class molecular chaperone
MKKNQEIIFPNESDETLNSFAGNIIFILKQKPHEFFDRIDNDLYLKKKINLTKENLLSKFEINHLDGRLLFISCVNIEKGVYKKINNEGMPIYNKSNENGNLYIYFEGVSPTIIIPYDVIIYAKNEIKELKI